MPNAEGDADRKGEQLISGWSISSWDDFPGEIEGLDCVEIAKGLWKKSRVDALVDVEGGGVVTGE